MKRLLCILYLLPPAVWGVERNELNVMLQAAATNQGAAYLVARNAIANLDTNALPILAPIASGQCNAGRPAGGEVVFVLPVGE